MDEQDIEASDAALTVLTRGRFDMAVRSESDKVLMVFENKVWSDFGKSQLAKYRRQLAKQGVSDGLRRCYLVSITPYGEKPNGVDKHIRWSQVHIALERAARACSDRFLKKVCEHFATFLKKKGLAPMKLEKPTPEMLRRFNDGLKYREDLERVLTSLKNYKRLQSYLKRKQVVVEPYPESYETYLGIYGRRQTPQFYIGFKVSGLRESPRITAMVSFSLNGDKHNLRKVGDLKLPKPGVYLKKERETWFEFKRELSEKSSCDGEIIRDWFVKESEKALNILES